MSMRIVRPRMSGVNAYRYRPWNRAEGPLLRGMSGHVFKGRPALATEIAPGVYTGLLTYEMGDWEDGQRHARILGMHVDARARRQSTMTVLYRRLRGELIRADVDRLRADATTRAGACFLHGQGIGVWYITPGGIALCEGAVCGPAVDLPVWSAERVRALRDCAGCGRLSEGCCDDCRVVESASDRRY